MSFLIPTPTQAHAGLRAMLTTLTAAGPLDEVRRAALGAVQQHLLRTDYDLDALAPIPPDALAAAIDDPALRAQLIAGMSTLALARHPVDAREIETVAAFAAALEVDSAALHQLRRLHDERTILLRIDAARRGPGGPVIAQLYEDQGFLGLLKNLGSYAGLFENRALSARYRALETYADGTLGKELWRFWDRHGYALPGEKHGAPEPLVTHDLSHVLGGYETDLDGESQVLAFQAGYRKQDPFGVLVFLLLQAQHNVRLTPLAECATGYYDGKPALIEDMVRAFARGARMTQDLGDHWDFWAVMDVPVEEVRRRYGVGVG